MKNDDLKFRWVQVNANWWYCPRFKLSVDKDMITGRWRTLGKSDYETYDTADEARAAREASYISKCRGSSKILTDRLNAEGAKQ